MTATQAGHVLKSMKFVAWILAILLFLAVVFAGRLQEALEIEGDLIARIGLLAVATAVVAVAAGMIVAGLWKLHEKPSGVRVAPFVVIEETGKLTNASDGLAKLLVARIEHIKADMRRSNQILSGKYGTPVGGEDEPAPAAGPLGDSFLRGSVPTREDALLAKLFASGAGAEKLELTVQGVDLGGLVEWVKRRVSQPADAISFTVNIDADRGVSIAGDIKALGIEGKETVWIPPHNQGLGEAIDELAYRLYQHALAARENRIGDLEIAEFRELMQKLADLEGDLARLRSAEHEQRRAQEAYEVLRRVLARFAEWPALAQVCDHTARRTVRLAEARVNYQTALASARAALAADAGEDDAKARLAAVGFLQLQIALIDRELAAAQTVVAARGGAGGATEMLRKSVDDLDAAELAVLRAGFALLRSDSADTPDLQALADIYARNRLAFQPGFLPWNRAFLHFVENAVRKKVPDFVLACWDFDAAELPDAFVVETLADGSANPLFLPVDPVATNPLQPDDSGGPVRGTTTIRPLAAVRDMPILVDEFPAFSSMVEAQLNNIRHVMVGGAMAQVHAAPLDPLFYAHACAVDRVWANWQAQRPDASYPEDFDSLMLIPFELSATSVIHFSRLGYRYPGP